MQDFQGHCPFCSSVLCFNFSIGIVLVFVSLEKLLNMIRDGTQVSQEVCLAKCTPVAPDLACFLDMWSC